MEDLEDDPVVNGDRSGCVLAEPMASGNKGRIQHRSAETKKDTEVTEAVPPEQVDKSP